MSRRGPAGPASPGQGARAQPPRPGTGCGNSSRACPATPCLSSISRRLSRLPGRREAVPVESPTPRSGRPGSVSCPPRDLTDDPLPAAALIIDKARFRLPTPPLKVIYSGPSRASIQGTLQERFASVPAPHRRTGEGPCKECVNHGDEKFQGCGREGKRGALDYGLNVG